MNELPISHSGPTLFILMDKNNKCTQNLYYNNFMSIDQKETNQFNQAKNELMSFIYSAWLYTFFIDKLLVMGFGIINSILICSIDHLCLLMLSLVLRYLMSIYFCFYYLFLIKEGYSRITAEYLYGLTVKSTILRLLTKCLIYHVYVLNS